MIKLESLYYSYILFSICLKTRQLHVFTSTSLKSQFDSFDMACQAISIRLFERLLLDYTSLKQNRLIYDAHMGGWYILTNAECYDNTLLETLCVHQSWKDLRGDSTHKARPSEVVFVGSQSGPHVLHPPPRYAFWLLHSKSPIAAPLSVFSFPLCTVWSLQAPWQIPIKCQLWHYACVSISQRRYVCTVCLIMPITRIFKCFPDEFMV